MGWVFGLVGVIYWFGLVFCLGLWLFVLVVLVGYCGVGVVVVGHFIWFFCLRFGFCAWLGFLVCN